MDSLYPQSVARFYDTIYHSVRDGVDNDYFLRQALEAKGPVLEAGVGTGRLFMASLEKGADIYGLDISQTMIDILLAKIPGKHHHRISRQNITNFRYDRDFDLIVAPFRVLMHLQAKEEQAAALNNVWGHLKPGGRFIFDLFVPDPSHLTKGMDNVVDFDGEYAPGRRLRRIVSTVPDLVNQTIAVHFRLEWDEDGTLKTDDWKTIMRFYFRFELEHLIERSKFKTYEISGDYKGTPLSGGSKEFVVTCTK